MIETSNTPGPAMTITGNRIGPKPWDECTQAEQIERLKEEARGWRTLYNGMQSRLSALERHQHAPGGGLVIPYDSLTKGMQGVGSTWDMLR